MVFPRFRWGGGGGGGGGGVGGGGRGMSMHVILKSLLSAEFNHLQRGERRVY